VHLCRVVFDSVTVRSLSQVEGAANMTQTPLTKIEAQQIIVDRHGISSIVRYIESSRLPRPVRLEELPDFAIKLQELSVALRDDNHPHIC
jgi:hypothetical protein